MANQLNSALPLVHVTIFNATSSKEEIIHYLKVSADKKHNSITNEIPGAKSRHL